MASRPVLIPDPDPRGRLVEERKVEFRWFPGFSVPQKQRSIRSLHEAAGLSPILEVSTKSPDPLGRRLSAFNLRVRLRGEPVLLEAAFQGSKVFADGQGPFESLYALNSGREVKRRMRPYLDATLREFRWDGQSWPLTPRTAFYDWLYLTAVRDLTRSRPEIDDELLGYRAFTDIEFNPRRSFNCQARSCALYVALLKQGGRDRLDLVDDPEKFLEALGVHGYGDGDSKEDSSGLGDSGGQPSLFRD